MDRFLNHTEVKVTQKEDIFYLTAPPRQGGIWELGWRSWFAAASGPNPGCSGLWNGEVGFPASGPNPGVARLVAFDEVPYLTEIGGPRHYISR